MHKQYETTVKIHAEFTDKEKQILKHTRKCPLGTYQEEEYYEKTEFTLNEIQEIANNIAITTGNTQAPIDNIFKPTRTEQPIDVPGDGTLSNTATKLHNQLQSILQDWDEEQIKQHQ